MVVAVAGPSPGILLSVLTASAMLNAELATPLKVGQRLNCRLCKGEIKAVKQIAEFTFEFEYDRFESAV